VIFQPVQTARLTLRCVEAADAVALSVLMTPEISRWVASWPMPFSEDMATERISAELALARAGDGWPVAISLRESGDLAGWAAIHRDPLDRRRGALGFWLGLAHHGKGLMQEAAGALVAAGFELLDVDVIEAGAQTGNLASLAVLRACGMRFVGERMVFAPARQREELCCFYEKWVG